MLSDEEYPSNLNGVLHKKRRVAKACDVCRKRKMRCDGMEDSTIRCTNCNLNDNECTYNDNIRRRAPNKRYVENLEKRIEQMEQLMQRVQPDLDTLDTPRSDPSTPATHPMSPLHASFKILHSNQISVGSDDIEGDPCDLEHMRIHTISDIAERQRTGERPSYHFLGKSSQAMLIRKALDTKQNYYTQYQQTTGETTKSAFMSSLREEFWTSRPWESKFLHITASKAYTFPDEDLMWALIDLYFEQINIIFPLLHRPTLEKALRDKVHHHNDSFASLLLVLCAAASRWSDDPRVLLDPADANSCGWAWFQQVEVERGTITSPARSLYDLQFYCICAQYLHGSSLSHVSWTIVGLGLRLAQELGIHRRKTPASSWTIEDELWKRVFWVLLVHDRMICTILGRPCAIQDEDFDADMPLECDDAYWDNPEHPFVQPPTKPSTITAFNLYINIAHLHGFVLRSIYALNKPKVILGSQWHVWEEHIVSELNLALNKWLDSVPPFLRWDPENLNPDPRMARLSGLIYAAFYQLQILVHRPFIANRKSPLSGPSLAICASAARSCSRIIEVLARDQREEVFFQPAAFTCGVVLLLNKWSRKRPSETDAKDMEYVHICLSSLERCRTRWIVAGKLCDVLKNISSLEELMKQPPSSMEAMHALPDSDEGILSSVPPLTVADNSKYNFWYSSMESNCLPYPDEGPPNIEAGVGELGGYTTSSENFPNPDFQEDPNIDNNMLAMWSLIPNGLEFDNWSSYLNDMTQGTNGDQTS